MEKRKKSFGKNSFENMVIKLSQVILNMIKFRKNEHIFYINTLQKLNNNSRDPGNKRNRIGLLMIWILSWIKIVFKVT